MKKNKKRGVYIILWLFLLFLLYNIFWLVWRTHKYSEYTQDFEPLTKYMRYVHTDEDYTYNIKLPDYLSYTGNLCVATRDGKYALLIWPQKNGQYEYGVQLEIDKKIYSIMIDEQLNTNDPQDQSLIVPYKQTIIDLFNKATDMWNI